VAQPREEKEKNEKQHTEESSERQKGRKAERQKGRKDIVEHDEPSRSCWSCVVRLVAKRRRM